MKFTKKNLTPWLRSLVCLCILQSAWSTHSVDFTLGQSTEATTGQKVRIPVTVDNFEGVASIQFTVQWPPAVLEFVQVLDFNLQFLTSGSFGASSVSQGILTLSWEDQDLTGETFNDGDELFAIEFNIVGDPGEQGEILFSDQPTPMEVADSNFNVIAFNSHNGFIAVAEVGNPPVLSAIEDQGIDEDPLSPLEIDFTVSDQETAASDLVIEVTSANPNIVESASIGVLGTTENRTLTLTPLADAFGLSHITVKVTDADNRSTQTVFTLIVNPVNDPPVLQVDDPAVSMAEDSVLNVPFQILDIETSLAELVVQVTSSNQGLVPNANLVITGEGTVRNLEITPVPNGFGSVTLTLSVSDGSSVTSRSVEVTVNAVNDPPVISNIANQFVIKDFTSAPIPFTFQDVETPVDELEITLESSDTTLVPLANMVLDGTGMDRTLTITPAAGLDGEVTITVKVDDGTVISSESFVLSVSDEFPSVVVETTQSMDEDGLLEIPFTVNDNNTSLDDLLIHASSGDPNLIPDSSIFLAGNGSDRTLTVVPRANHYGEVVVTLSVQDSDNHLVEIPITISVNPVNDPPFIVQVPSSLELDEDMQAGFEFIVGDLETALENLALTGMSAETQLLPPDSTTFDPPSSDGVVSLMAILDGASERPVPVNTMANGAALFVLQGSDLIVNVFYQNLTSTIVGAHIHGPADAEGTADVLVNLQPVHVGAFSGISGQFSGVITGLSEETIEDLITGQTYVNIHSQNFGGGEIRGQVHTTPAFAGQVQATVHPALNAFGETTLTVQVSDGLESVSSDIAVTVNPVNDTPVLDMISEVVIDEDAQATVALDISDVETSQAHILVDIQSSNPNLILAEQISLIESDETLEMVLMPLPNAFGSSEIQVIIEDEGGLMTSKTLSLTVHPVNDVPHIGPLGDVVMNEDTQQTVSIGISDVETNPDDLILSVQSNNSILFPQDTLQFHGGGESRSLNLAPASNQFGSATLTITVDDGTDTFQEAFVVTVHDVFYNDGAGLDGYVAGGTVYFDANKSRTLDGGEPSTLTDNQGKFLLQVVVVNFDTNGNGVLDPAEGQLVMEGGIDIATGLAMQVKLTAPPQATVVNPLTTLINEVLNKNPNLTVAQAEAKVEASMGITGDVGNRVDLLHYDPFDAAQAGDNDSTPILNASSKVQDTIVQISSLVSGNTSQGQEQTANTVVDVLAGKILNDESVDLSHDEKVQEIIVGTAIQSGANLDSAISDGASEIIAGTNAKKDSAAQSAGSTIQAATEISKVQGVAQSSVSTDLGSVGAGNQSVDDAINKNTGNNLTTSINNATVGDVLGTETRPGTFSFKSDEFSVNENGSNILAVTLVRADGNKGAVNVEVTLSNQIATSPADYLAQTIVVSFGSEEISKTLDLSAVIQNDAIVEGDETVNLTLALEAGAPAEAQLGARTTSTLKIVDNDSVGTFTFSANAFSVRESGENLTAVTVNRSGGAAGPVSVIVNAAELPGGATAGMDFTAGDVTVTFEANQQSKRVVMPINNDAVVENDETVGLTLSLGDNPPAGAQLGAITSATLTIVNDDFNTPPTIAAIANQSMNEDTTLSGIALNVGDTEDDVNTLVVTAESSNPDLVTQQNLSVEGSGANRTLSIKPNNNAFGSATITVRVDDGQVQESRSFDLTVNNVNDPPVVGVIGDFSMDEDQGVLNVPFTLSDIDSDVNNLIVRASSDNPTLLPENLLVLSGTGAQRNLNLTTLPDAFGTATVTITAADSSFQTGVDFVLTVNNINDPPTLGGVADQVTDEDQALVVEIAYSDGDNGEDQLGLSVTASNQVLFPADRITIHRLNGLATITLNPAPEQSGSSAVQVNLTDSEFSVSQDFYVTVNEVNDTPTISQITDVTLDEDQKRAIEFTIQDLETGANELEITVSGDNNLLLGETSLILGGTGNDRTLTIEPLSDQNGHVNIEITVSDGNTRAESTFGVTVRAVNDSPSISVIENLTANAGEVVRVTFEVGDLEDQPDVLNLSVFSLDETIVMPEGLVLEGQGSQRTLTVTPVSGVGGEAVIRVQVEDSEGARLRQTFAITYNQPDPAVLSVSIGNGKITISWEGQGQLQAADRITGPYLPVEGATSPFEMDPVGSGRFFRIIN